MIKRFRFGTPLPTESVVMDLPLCEEAVPFLQGTPACFTYLLGEDDLVFGLGESIRASTAGLALCELLQRRSEPYRGEDLSLRRPQLPAGGRRRRAVRPFLGLRRAGGVRRGLHPRDLLQIHARG